MQYIVYKTGLEYLVKRGRYYIFHDTITDLYGFVENNGQAYIEPPHCSLGLAMVHHAISQLEG